MKTRILLLIAMIMISSPVAAWIAYGFHSGMSRFEVTRQLSEKESLVVTEGIQQTFAGPDDNSEKYNLIYCSSPQKLYLMKFRLADSPAEFVKAKEKFEKRYGEAEGPDDWESANWEDAEISFIWDLNESETILLTRNGTGTGAEFQDLSVCK
jgi:hypothetical protein